MKIASLGECMLELVPNTQGNYTLNYGGDTLNTAVYLARLGSEVSYVTSLGSDPFSEKMIAQWKAENIDTTLVEISSTKLPGLYAIQTDEHGERSFFYWRSDSAAKHMFSRQQQYLNKLNSFDCVYLSGITLSLFSDKTFPQFLDFAKRYREQGKRVAFDLNYRVANWQSPEHARARIAELLAVVDIALPSFDDEQVLYGEGSVEQCIDRYKSAGVKEVVLKNGTDGCYYLRNGDLSHFPIGTVVKPTDTTAAGDSFNAGFLNARLREKEPQEAIAAGQHCAAIVIQHPGAIVDANLFKG